MKTSLLFLCIGLTLFTLISGTQKKDNSRDLIGDVIYSVIPPQQFQDINGDKWVQMRGQPVDPEWQISKLTSFENNLLPDARGTFVRIADDGAGRDEVADRKIGSYQEDALQQHYHDLHEVMFENGGNNEKFRVTGQDGLGYESIMNTIPLSGARDARISGTETRPKNIVLYAYIKVD